jgi:hypothetical protein
MTTRLEAIWIAITAYPTDGLAIEAVERSRHFGLGADEIDPDQSHDHCPDCGAPPSLANTCRDDMDTPCHTCGAPLPPSPVQRIGWNGVEDDDLSF